MSVTLDMFDPGSDGKPYPAGTAIFSAGDIGKEMYLILEGQVELTIGGSVVETLGPGEPFGEMALMDSEPRGASAIARTPCRLVPISEERFLYLIQDTPYFGLQIMKVMAHRLRKMNTRATGDSRTG